MLAAAANQVGFDLFYGARLYLGSVPVVLALLLLGERGLPVGVASVLLVPRLWGEPQAAIILLAELLWLSGFLRLREDQEERRERGDIVLADVLFWIVVAIPFDVLMFGVIANVDLPSVLDLSLLQAVNGSLNAAIAYALFLLVRIMQSRHDPARSISLHGLVLIATLGLALSAGILTLVFGMRQIDHVVVDAKLSRFRQLALTTSVLDSDQLTELAGVRDQNEVSMDFQVLDEQGRSIYSSNPPLFQALESRYVEPDVPLPRHPQVAEPLDLLIPIESQHAAVPALRGFWRYETRDDRDMRNGPLALKAPDRMIVVVEPARGFFRDLQAQSSRAIRELALLMLTALIAARTISRFVVGQVPGPSVLEGEPGQGDHASSVASPDPRRVHQFPDGLQTSLRELQPLLQVLRSRGDLLKSLRETLRRSERQRHRLEAEVGRLNIMDPLTGCFNRRELYRRLDHELRLSGREQRDLSVLALEVDHLRHIHDSYGPAVHEEILRRVALELRSRTRATDFLCRLGPEQFGLLLRSCDTSSAAKVGELLRSVVRSLEIRHEGVILSVTLSAGVVSLQSSREDADALITRAQSALYRAKADGRDRVVVG